MPKFAVDFERTLSATASVGTLVGDGSAARRAKVYFITFGCAGGTVSDAFNKWVFQRVTAAGTATSVTPQLLDPGETAAINDAAENHTVEPTYTAGAILLNKGLHCRAQYDVQLGPGRELILPATAAAGLGIQTPTAGTTIAAVAQLHYEE